MVNFHTKYPYFDIFWRALEWKIWIYFVVMWYILWSYGIFCGHMVYFVVIWYILLSFGIVFPQFGMLF
jgi:hypothetical protein